MPTVAPEPDPLEKEAVRFFEAVQRATDSRLKSVSIPFRSATLDIELPPLGEGDRGIVYPLRSHSLRLAPPQAKLCVKVAKQQPICRERLLEELKTTDFFLSEQIRVPRIHYMDPAGLFCIKDLIEGESLTSLYLRFDRLTLATQRLLLEGLQKFLDRLLLLFRKRPDCKVSISPNNIYVLSDRDRFKDPAEFVLIDPGTTLKKDYTNFNFTMYWNEVLPDRIRKYQRTGYLQWLVPRDVNRSERDEASGFAIFDALKPAEVFLLLKTAKTVEFEPEEVILREDSVGENFYLILEGEVEVRKGLYVKPGSWNLRYTRGSVLGEVAFLLHVPRSMTVVAASPCKLIEIDRDRFNELLAANLTAPYKLLRNIAVTLAERLHKLTVSHQRLMETQGNDPR